eukprot:1139261-Pelagomonas_calceolata.AAC.4
MAKEIGLTSTALLVENSLNRHIPELLPGQLAHNAGHSSMDFLHFPTLGNKPYQPQNLTL